MLNNQIHSIYETIFTFHDDKTSYDIVMEILKDHFCDNYEDQESFDKEVAKALVSFNLFKDKYSLPEGETYHDPKGLAGECQSVRLVCRNTINN